MKKEYKWEKNKRKKNIIQVRIYFIQEFTENNKTKTVKNIFFN